jgi:hypothetical protein
MPIEDGTGCLVLDGVEAQRRYADHLKNEALGWENTDWSIVPYERLQWRPLHDRCDPQGGRAEDYRVEVEQLRTAADLVEQTQWWNGQRWFKGAWTDWFTRVLPRVLELVVDPT